MKKRCYKVFLLMQYTSWFLCERERKKAWSNTQKSLTTMRFRWRTHPTPQDGFTESPRILDKESYFYISVLMGYWKEGRQAGRKKEGRKEIKGKEGGRREGRSEGGRQNSTTLEKAIFYSWQDLLSGWQQRSSLGNTFSSWWTKFFTALRGL